MIASVRGTVLSLRLEGVVVEVGGVGLLVHTTPAALAELRHGGEALLHTSLVVREDSLTLYGFADADERDVFLIVQTANGIGPRLALAMLAVHRPDDLRRAVAGDDLKTLMRVPGIGRKVAERLVLELRDRLGAPSGALAGSGGAAAATGSVPAQRSAAPPSPVVEALVGLGWGLKQAEDAVIAVRSADGADPSAAVEPGELPALLRAALRRLGGS